MNYNEFQADFMRENRKLRLLLILSIIVSTVLCLLQYSERRYFLYRGGEVFKERPLIEEICREGFTAITKGTPNHHIIEQGVLDIIETNPFNVAIDEILAVKSSELGQCKIVLISEGKLAAFEIGTTQSEDHPFFYKLATIDEVVAKEQEL